MPSSRCYGPSNLSNGTAENNMLEILDRLGDTTRGPELEGDPQEEKRATLSLPT